MDIITDEVAYAMAVDNARRERARIRAVQAGALRELRKQVSLLGWDDGSAEREVIACIRAIDAATRAPRPVAPGKEHCGQCGKPFPSVACGPTHATRWHEIWSSASRELRDKLRSKATRAPRNGKAK